MNNNICQFYVILGNRSFIPPTNNNAYINATDIHDLKELSEKILDTYKEKAKLGFKVGSEIIFLIPNEKYIPYTEEAIKKLKVNGKIEVLPSKPVIQKPIINQQKEQPIEIKEEQKITTSSDKVPEKNENNKVVPNQEELKIEQPKITEEKKEEKAPIYHPTDNIYRGTIDSNTYNKIKPIKKSNKAPIIIFIISLIFFIISLILLLFA